MIVRNENTTMCCSYVVLLVIASIGCTTSVHPLLLKEDLSVDIDLSGEWIRHSPVAPGEAKEVRRMILKRVGDTAVYDVKGEDGEQVFDALQVGKVGSIRIGELRGGPRDGHSPFESGLPLYGFARFEIVNDDLQVFPVNDVEILRRLTERKASYLVHESGPGAEWVIITATTTELQSLIKAFADDIFASSPIVFKRTTGK